MTRLDLAEATGEDQRGADAVATVLGRPGLLFRPSGTPTSTSTIRTAANASAIRDDLLRRRLAGLPRSRAHRSTDADSRRSACRVNLSTCISDMPEPSMHCLASCQGSRIRDFDP